jgi:hypothetical protein
VIPVSSGPPRHAALSDFEAERIAGLFAQARHEVRDRAHAAFGDVNRGKRAALIEVAARLGEIEDEARNLLGLESLRNPAGPEPAAGPDMLQRLPAASPRAAVGVSPVIPAPARVARRWLGRWWAS